MDNGITWQTTSGNMTATETALNAPPNITAGAQRLHNMKCAAFVKGEKRRAMVDYASLIVSILLIITLLKQLNK